MIKYSFILIALFYFSACDEVKSSQERDDDNGQNNLLVDTATVHSNIISFSPFHLEDSVSVNSQITIQFTNDITFTNDTVFLELFGVDNSKTDCRIDQDGFKCGDLNSNDSFLQLFGVVNNDIATGEIVFGNAVVNASQSVTITPERPLISGITYVVHIFHDAANSDNSLKTWWMFRTL